MRGLYVALGTVITIVLVLTFTMGIQAAPPALPSAFYGGVSVDRISDLTGAQVRALIGDIEFGRATVRQEPSLGWVYVLNVRGDDLDTSAIEGGREGDLVTFIVDLPDGRSYPMVQMGTWHGGSSVELPLSSYCTLVLPLIMVAS